MWTKNDTSAQKFSIWGLPKPGASTLHVAAGSSFEETVFTWNESSDTKSYDVKIWRDKLWDGDPYCVEWGAQNFKWSKQLPAGYYEAYVDSKNNYSLTMGNVVKFTVSEGSPIDLGTDFYASIISVNAGKPITDDGADNENNVSIRSETGAENQVWKFDRYEDGSYKIINCQSGRALDVYEASSKSDTNVWTYVSNDTDAQKWCVYKKDGAYYLRAKCTSCVLDVSWASTEDGASLISSNLHYGSNQQFKIWKVPTSNVEDLGTDFCASIISVNAGKPITDDGTDNENNVSIRSETGAANQTWKFDKYEDGSYKITNCQSERVLDVYGGSSKSDTNVWTCVSNNTDAQK